MADISISKEQVRRIYALGAAVGILESGNKEDNLHALVLRITGKDSVSAMTAAEFKMVERELLTLMQYKNRQTPLKSKTIKSVAVSPGMMNAAQQSKAWKLIYRLIDLDTHKSKATPGERMVGAIKTILGVDAKVANPFQWITFEQGFKLIEKLKLYVRSAETRER
ncbi:MAG: phage protein GemA/Gp16 family protein [Burkholderiales bacterium]